ncbi:MAG: Hpt domain-containing protein [Spirochaetales bacterium]|nr:Hpt domain-containing protein [Spirochaetales bacterium]
MSIESLFALSKLPEKKKWVFSEEEITKLFWKYKGQLLEYKRNAAFWAATNENLKTAYETLDEQEQALERAYNLNKKYLDNIQEGLLLIDRNFIILSQYSTYLKSLFMTDKIEGEYIIDFLFPDKKKNIQECMELEKYLTILFQNKQASMEMINELNPLIDKKILIMREGREYEKTINTRFIRIYKEEEIEHVMMIFEDKTESIRMKKELEKEKSRNKAELDSILAILRVGPDAFFDFIEESSRILDSLNNQVPDIDKKNTLNMMFRQIHSLKGSAKYFELNHIAHLSHSLEDALSGCIKDEGLCTTEIKRKINAMIGHLWTEFQIIDKLNTRFQMFYERAAQRNNDNGTVKLSGFFNTLKRMTKNLAKDQSKEVQLQIKNDLNDFPCFNQLKTPIIQIIRNAVSHGIEDTYERLSLKKKQIGKIDMRFHKDGDSFVIEITDDGRGLNFEKIREKAVVKHLIPDDVNSVPKEKLLQILFNPDFSSQEEANEISGRGFGLDIVKNVVSELHGKVTVATRPNIGTRFTIKIPDTKGGARHVK